MSAASDRTRLLGLVCITSEPRSTGREERVREFCGPRASTDSQAFTRGTVSEILSDGVILNYGFGPWGVVSRVCLAGVHWDVRETFVVRGRGAGSSLVVCMFPFYVRVKMLILL